MTGDGRLPDTLEDSPSSSTQGERLARDGLYPRVLGDERFEPLAIGRGSLRAQCQHFHDEESSGDGYAARALSGRPWPRAAARRCRTRRAAMTPMKLLTLASACRSAISSW